MNNIQGKSFYIYGDTSKRQLGYIAQDILPHIPEVVYVDASDLNNHHYLQYDKLVPVLSEAIKELSNKVEDLTTRAVALENA